MVSPGGFAIAIGVLIVVWLFLPDKVRPWLAVLLVLSVLGASGKPRETIDRFFALIK